jgi:hypothetical protein
MKDFVKETEKLPAIAPTYGVHFIDMLHHFEAYRRGIKVDKATGKLSLLFVLRDILFILAHE